VLLWGAASSPANHIPPQCTSNHQQGSLCIQVTDTPADEVSYSTFDGDKAYVFYHAVVSNTGRSNLSHVGVTETLDPRTPFLSVTSTGGSCSEANGVVTCALGSMKSGKSISIDTVVISPTSDPNTIPPDITITNTVEAAFDERFSDQNGGKQDTVIYSEPTVVSADAGQAYIPKTKTGKISTDTTASQYANVTVPEVSTDVYATIQLLDPDTFCVGGKVTVGNKTYYCRNGGFVEASVLEFGTTNHYSNSKAPLVFHLRWAAGLVDPHQTVKNFVVFYTPTGNLQDLTVVGQTCNASHTNLPCIENVMFNADGSLTADLVRPDNGRMR
jgi:uncharacterized repeat protein (TIGR01451 family)